ncbi:MAG: SMP-30/gluconolactonase/LRE family protein [Rhodothermales bacterium]
MQRLASVLSLLVFLVLLGCESKEATMEEAQAESVASVSWDAPQMLGDRLFSVEGFSGPEAVRYDPAQDVYFVANFNDKPAGDANGFVSRIGADGTVEELQYMTGTDTYPLHGARGMFIVDDLLWVADAGGIHGFNRETGEHNTFVDFSAYELGFLNDIVQGPDGALYVTETGSASRVFRVEDGEVTIAIQDEKIGAPNGITWDAEGERFIVVAWSGTQSFQSWKHGSTELMEFAVSEGGNFDGVEMIGSRALVASQADSSLRLVEAGVSRKYIQLPAGPADIGIDTKRMRVAVPYVAENRVDVWALPGE